MDPPLTPGTVIDPPLPTPLSAVIQMSRLFMKSPRLIDFASFYQNGAAMSTHIKKYKGQPRRAARRRCTNLTISTTGMTRKASPSAVKYSTAEMCSNPNAAERNGT